MVAKIIWKKKSIADNCWKNEKLNINGFISCNL